MYGTNWYLVRSVENFSSWPCNYPWPGHYRVNPCLFAYPTKNIHFSYAVLPWVQSTVVSFDTSFGKIKIHHLSKCFIVRSVGCSFLRSEQQPTYVWSCNGSLDITLTLWILDWILPRNSFVSNIYSQLGYFRVSGSCKWLSLQCLVLGLYISKRGRITSISL